MGSRSGGKRRSYIYKRGVEKITYEEVINGVTVIRTRFRFGKKKRKKNK